MCIITLFTSSPDDPLKYYGRHDPNSLVTDNSLNEILNVLKSMPDHSALVRKKISCRSEENDISSTPSLPRCVSSVSPIHCFVPLSSVDCNKTHCLLSPFIPLQVLVYTLCNLGSSETEKVGCSWGRKSTRCQPFQSYNHCVIKWFMPAVLVFATLIRMNAKNKNTFYVTDEFIAKVIEVEKYKYSK